MVIYKKGDLVQLARQGEYDVVLHGANCFCKMDDGIARQLVQEFPEILKTDCKTMPGDKAKLGSYTKTRVVRNGKSFYIINCYTQFGYAGMDLETADYFDYKAYERVMKAISRDFNDLKIAMPLIGSGHAGGNQEKILEMTEKIFRYQKVEIIVYSDFNQPKQLNSLKNKLAQLLFLSF